MWRHAAARRVRRAKCVPLRAVIGSFLRFFKQKHVGDTPLLMHIIKTLGLHNVTSFHNVMMSLMMLSHAHAAGHMTF